MRLFILSITGIIKVLYLEFLRNKKTMATESLKQRDMNDDYKCHRLAILLALEYYHRTLCGHYSILSHIQVFIIPNRKQPVYVSNICNGKNIS